MGLRERAQNTLMTKNGKSVKIRDDEITFGRERGPLAGARAMVDTAGTLDKRVTATRLMMTGPLAFGLRKKKGRPRALSVGRRRWIRVLGKA
jgi:hypothetical protein